jgi:phosphotransferase system HPr (HPr) family protein
VGCTGGQHRSVVLAEQIARTLKLGGFNVAVRHREAAMVVRTLAEFQSKVTLSNGKVSADARSVLDLISLAASRGTALTIKATGEDAEAAVAALASLVARNFAE